MFIIYSIFIGFFILVKKNLNEKNFVYLKYNIVIIYNYTYTCFSKIWIYEKNNHFYNLFAKGFKKEWGSQANESQKIEVLTKTVGRESRAVTYNHVLY